MKSRHKRRAARNKKNAAMRAGQLNPGGKSRYGKKNEFCTAHGVDAIQVRDKAIWGGSNEIRREARYPGNGFVASTGAEMSAARNLR